MDAPLLVIGLVAADLVLVAACLIVGIHHLRQATKHHDGPADPISIAEQSARITNGRLILGVTAAVIILTPLALWITI
jgi:hypothetical protein